ncbi:hypothetical protein B4U80_12588 [Leptotrombidium deliense]|uniref:C2H2-type domain-containing protein n=1 Tax=Leptotrombidium deliense TaxID=299467 RepID=A0A443RD37_9ACAR|nr:hypothetical protein B4U80_12588 [Leptotrombidium deliense]
MTFVIFSDVNLSDNVSSEEEIEEIETKKRKKKSHGTGKHKCHHRGCKYSNDNLKKVEDHQKRPKSSYNPAHPDAPGKAVVLANDEDLFPCQQCELTYANRSNLTRHIKLKH